MKIAKTIIATILLIAGTLPMASAQAPQPKQAIMGVKTYDFKKGAMRFTFTTALPVMALVQISRKPLVNDKLQSVLSRGASTTPLKNHKIDVYGLGDKPREQFYYVIYADAERKTGTCYANTAID